ncbi:MAG: M48 family metalloprotease [Gammaproteobacteria bacterium]|jgi:predicted Zn-dependent protease
MKSKFILPVLLLSLSLFGGCAVNPVSGKQDLVLMSESDEIALGHKTNQQVLQQYRVYDDPALQAYVQKIGNKVALKSHRNSLDYSFTVLDSQEVNAFALPGGYIYITRGLMSYLKSEAELAAVLGHEVGHVTARHSVRQHSANQLTNLGLTLGSLFVPGMNQASSQLAQLFGAALLRGYGREHELEADRLGAEYLARTGYNPNAMLDVISVLKNQEVFEREVAKAEGREPRIYHGVFSTHPDSDTRLQEVVGTAHGLAENTSSAKFVGHEEYMSYVNKMVYGDSPRDGILRGNRFFHEDLNFSMTFPKKWKVSNLPDRIVLAAPGGAAIMQITVEDIDKNISPRNFMIQRMGLNNLKNEAKLNINGLQAHTGVSVINTKDGARPTRFTVIYFEQRAYVVAGTAQVANNLAKYDQAMLNTAKSFHALTKKERALAKPLRLKVIQANKKTRLAELAKKSSLDAHAESQLRLLNAMYPKGEPKKGQLLKVVE